MRIFVAGASGVIGIQLIPSLVRLGHTVAGMTRNTRKGQLVAELGATAVVCDIYDKTELQKRIGEFRPEMIISQLTDLPDKPEEMPSYAAKNNRIRTEGIGNLIDSASKAGSPRLVVQSVAWELPGNGGESVRMMEKNVLEYGGTVLRYGMLYGPGTFYEKELPPEPRVSVEKACQLTVEKMNSEEKIIEITDHS